MPSVSWRKPNSSTRTSPSTPSTTHSLIFGLFVWYDVCFFAFSLFFLSILSPWLMQVRTGIFDDSPPPMMSKWKETNTRLTGHTTLDRTSVFFLCVFFVVKHVLLFAVWFASRRCWLLEPVVSGGNSKPLFRNPFCQDGSEAPRVVFVSVSFRLSGRS